MATTASKTKNKSRGKKRVATEKVERLPGSAFLTCEHCSASVPRLLMDMHDCEAEHHLKESINRLHSEYEESKKLQAAKQAKAAAQKGDKKRKAEPATKDPNAPKKPKTAFFLFLDDFRPKHASDPELKKQGALAKAAGDAWKALSEEEKAVYVKLYEEKKAEHEKLMAEYLEKKASDKAAAMEGEGESNPVEEEEEGEGEEGEGDGEGEALEDDVEDPDA